MRQDEHARRALLPDLELITSSRPPPALIDYLIGYAFAVQILPHEDGRCLDILSLLLYPKGIVACRQGQKKGGATTRERIEHPQSPGKLVTVGACKNGDVEQHARKDFVGLAFVAANLRHFYGDKGCKYCF